MSIRSNMKSYDYYLTGSLNEYGEPTLSEKIGTIEMDIQLTTQSLKDFPLYSNTQYIGLTTEAVTDKYVIQFGSEMLKVLYVNGFGRYNQVYMERMN